MAAMARSNSSNGHGYHHEASTTSSSSSSTSLARGRRSLEQQVPGTPGRPLLFLTSSSSSPAHPQLVSSRRSVPSKWEDAEKWLTQSSDHRGHHHGKAASKQHHIGGPAPATARRTSLDANALALYTLPAEVLLKDKYTDNVEPSNESFVFRSSYCEPANNGAAAVTCGDDDFHRRDVGTEMTPLGSSPTSRCHTPVKSTSPARHNTPTGRSGPLVPYNSGSGMDISELTDCHFAKLDLGAQFDSMLVNWSSKEEEEEEVSKSLRHFEASAGDGGRACDKRVAAVTECRWEDDERAKSCIRYQREEAKIQAWINLESAKAEAQSRKLEVRMKSHLVHNAYCNSFRHHHKLHSEVQTTNLTA
uniref:Remorin C-terminal domain-containing protein n=1 Tax=Aegilops tauschii subsp. strangulata TaxID=200361 RepID=A0A453C9K1_AEGTS